MFSFVKTLLIPPPELRLHDVLYVRKVVQLFLVIQRGEQHREHPPTPYTLRLAHFLLSRTVLFLLQPACIVPLILLRSKMAAYILPTPEPWPV